MGERKVTNKYYPPDFDPTKAPKGTQPKNGQLNIRMMLPMSVRCATCGEYMYRGKKFNSKQERVEGETYLGIRLYRFYMKCTRCNATFCIRTDPQNTDYIVEAGATRNFEFFREQAEYKEAVEKRKEEEEMGNAMKALENRTEASRQEVEIQDAIDELRSLRGMHDQIKYEDMLAALYEKRAEIRKKEEEEAAEKAKNALNEEDEAEIAAAFKRKDGKSFIKRLDETKDPELPAKPAPTLFDPPKEKKKKKASGLVVVKPKKKNKEEKPAEKKEEKKAAEEEEGGLLSLVGYDKSSSSPSPPP